MKKIRAVGTRLAVILGLALLCSLPVLAGNQYDIYSKVTVGQKLPSGNLYALDGSVHQLSSLIEDKVSVVVLFATWCPYCGQLLESFVDGRRSEAEFAAANVLVLGREHSVDELLSYRDERNIPLQFFADPTAEVYDQLAHRSVPHTYIIDAQGKVVWHMAGFEPRVWPTMRKNILQQLRKNQNLEASKPAPAVPVENASTP